MSESKELLEATVKGLQDKLELLQAELNIKTLELSNMNKPKITGEQPFRPNNIKRPGLEL